MLAPLTALLVVQVTMYQTLRSAVQRVVSVVAGVVVAVALSAVAGFTWWSLTILVTAGLAVGYVLRLGDHILEVPISAMLILSLGGKAAATGRIVETLAGAAAGMLGGLILTPLRVQPAEEAIEELSRGLASLLEQMADDLGEGSTAAKADQRLAQARALDGEIQRVDRALAEAEESLRLNPRGRLLQHARITLRDGLETLEHATVTVRGIARGVARAANRTAARRAERAGLAPPWRAACPHRPLAQRASARTPTPVTARRDANGRRAAGYRHCPRGIRANGSGGDSRCEGRAHFAHLNYTI